MTAHKRSLLQKALAALAKSGPVTRDDALRVLGKVLQTKRQATLELYLLRRLGLVKSRVEVTEVGHERLRKLGEP